MFTKKVNHLGIICILSLVLAGCYNTSTSATNPQKINDKSVSIETFNPEDYSNKIEVASHPDFVKIYKNIDELEKDSANVVYGIVKETKSFDESGAAMTYYNFLIEKSYKGELKENDLISVLAVGGYIRLEKYIDVFGEGKFKDYTQQQRKEIVIKENPMEAPVPKQDEKYILFLSNPANDESPFPNGIYSEIGSFMGRYYFNEKANDPNAFTRYTPINELNFYGQKDKGYSLSEIENTLK